MLLRSFLLGLMVALLPAAAFADTDRENYDVGVVALQKKDCAAAADAFDRVRGPLSRDPSFILYAAKANECADRLEKALFYYRLSEEFSPNVSAVHQKIGELNYRLELQRRSGGVPSQGTPGVPVATGSVEFVSANEGPYNVEVQSGSGGTQTCEAPVTFLRPCTLRVPPGPVRVSVSGRSHFTRTLVVGETTRRITINGEDRHALQLGVEVTGGVSAGVLALGFANSAAGGNSNLTSLAEVVGILGLTVAGVACTPAFTSGDDLKLSDAGTGPLPRGTLFAGGGIVPIHNGVGLATSFQF